MQKSKSVFCKKIYEYKSISGIPDAYLDYLLVEGLDKNSLEEMIFKDSDSGILKGLMFKHKISKRNTVTEEKIKNLAFEFIQKDKKRELYNKANAFNNSTIRKFLENKKLLHVYESKELFIENLQELINRIDLTNLISHIRTEREDLHEIAPYLLATWEKSEDFEMFNFKDKFGFDADAIIESANDEMKSLNIDFDTNVGKDSMEEININDVDFDDINIPGLEKSIVTVKKYIDMIGRKALSNESYKKTIVELESDMDGLESENKEKAKVINRLEKKVKSSDIKIVKATTENEELKKVIEQNSNKIITLEDTVKDKSTKLDELKKDKRELNKKNKELALMVENLTHDIKKYQVERIEKEEEYDVAEKKNELLIQTNKLLTENNDSLKEIVNVLNKEIEKLKLEKTQIINKYECEMNELKSKLRENKIDKGIVIAPKEEKNNHEVDIYDYSELFGDDLSNNPTY